MIKELNLKEDTRFKIIDGILKFNNYPVSPILYQIADVPFQLHLTVRFNYSDLKKNNVSSESARKVFIKDLVFHTYKKLKLSQRNIQYFFATEYGMSGEAHMHILFRLKNLQDPQKGINLFSDEFRNQCAATGNSDTESILINNPKGAAAYLCKLEKRIDERGAYLGLQKDEWFLSTHLFNFLNRDKFD